MTYEFLKTAFLADSIIGVLEHAGFPGDQEAGLLDRRFAIDHLRQRITPAFIPMLIGVVNAQSGPAAGLAAALLRPYVHLTEVRDAFELRWRSASPYLRNRIMWQLLKLHDTSPKWQENFLHFLLSDWDVCRDFHYSFYGSREEALDRFLHRLGDPALADGEKWIYLCCALGEIRDRNSADVLISLGSTMGPFAHRLTRALVDRIFAGSFAAVGDDRASSPACDQLGLEFVAEAIVRNLRRGAVPSEEDADVLNRLPIIDAIRSRIEESDLQWVWRGVEAVGSERRGFYLSLLKSFAGVQQTQLRLQQRWQTADPFERAHLMWRILDDPKLDREWHRRMFQFVLANWNVFQDVSAKFLGASDVLINNTLRRLGDEDFPETKKWAYLCRVPTAANDQVAARALVQFGLMMKDEFTREVATELLKRFFNRSQGHMAA